MDENQIPHQAFLLLPFFFTTIAVMSIVMVIPYWQIFKKAGFSPWLSLLMLVPLVNIIILYVVAFSPWRVVPVPSVYPPVYPPGYPPVPPPTAGTIPPI
jgi:hypothetical protein